MPSLWPFIAADSDVVRPEK